MGQSSSQQLSIVEELSPFTLVPKTYPGSRKSQERAGLNYHIYLVITFIVLSLYNGESHLS